MGLLRLTACLPWSCLLVFSAGVVGCDVGSLEGHDLLVQLRTDLVPIEEFASVELVLTPREGGGSAVEQRLPNLADGYVPAVALMH